MDIKTKLLPILMVLFTLVVAAQEKYYTKTGAVFFEASTPNFEPVEAKNNSTSAVLKDDGNLAVLILIRGFRFKRALMQEHFNDRFMESETYPKAKFTGTIDNFNKDDLSENTKELTIKGSLTIHGKTKEVNTIGKFKKVDGVIYLNSAFNVQVIDFDIAVKSKVAKKIAKTVNLDVALKLKKK
jgi:hypothetical protein